jgi:HEAT repeat protein
MIDSVLDLLSSPDAECRAAGIRQASTSTDPILAVRLAERMRDPHRSDAQREVAAEALGAMPLDAARDVLLGAIVDQDPFLRGLAAVGLGHVDTPAAVPALLTALSDGTNTVRNLAERSLLALRESLRAHGVERLLELLAHPAPLTRSPAARLIGLTGDPRALAPLLAMLQHDRQWLVRLWAAKALGDLGMVEAADTLAHALQHDEKNRVRAAAAEAIGKLRPPHAENLLRAAFEKDDDGGVKKMAAEGLHALGLGGFGQENVAMDDE